MHTRGTVADESKVTYGRRRTDKPIPTGWRSLGIGVIRYRLLVGRERRSAERRVNASMPSIVRSPVPATRRAILQVHTDLGGSDPH